MLGRPAARCVCTLSPHFYSNVTFFLWRQHVFCDFEHVSIFSTCDLSWFPGALFLTISGSFSIHKLGLNVGKKPNASTFLCHSHPKHWIKILFFILFFFLELTNVKLLFDFQHDKLEPSKVTCSDSVSLVRTRYRFIAISFEAFHTLKLCFWLQL